MGRVTHWQDRLRPGDIVVMDAGDAGRVRVTFMRRQQGWLTVQLPKGSVLRCAPGTISMYTEKDHPTE